MKALFAFLGVLILLAGGAALIHPRFSTPSKKKEVQIENHKVIFESKRFFTVPPDLGRSCRGCRRLADFSWNAALKIQ